MSLNKVFKKIIAIALIFIISASNFAAVVSDNDGSAFITKAEFDSLKNNFQSQIDQYNISIDSKIDGAIAAYLAGIKTVVSETSKILVDNYSDMMWVGDYNVYGKWKKWTNNTTYTQDTTNKWFTPSLNEKRHTFRSSNGSFYSTWTQAWTQQSTYFEFYANTASNGLCQANSTEWASTGETGVPTLVILLQKDDNDNYVVTQPFNVYAMSAHSMSSLHVPGATTGQAAYQWGNSRWRATGIEILSKGSSDILKFKVTATRLGYGTSATYEDTLTPGNFPFPCTWCDDAHNAGSRNNRFATQTQAYNTGVTTSNYFNTGCTWHQLDNWTEQHDFIKKMMLGRSNTQQVNAAYYINYFGERGQYDFSKSTTSGTWSGKITDVTTINRYQPIQSDGITSTTTKVDVYASLSVPHWPTANLRDLTSGKFQYNNTGLKYGEGMPLRIDNQTDGYLQISFDSSVVGILAGGAHSSQDLRIDMRKESFLSSEANWAQGYKGLVNPNSTSETLVTLGGYRYTTTDGKIQLTVPMKKDESLWIRIAPWTSDKGYCAKWSNLSMTMNTN